MSEPVTRESIAGEMSEIATQEHSIHGSKQVTINSVNNALLGMSKFFLVRTEPNEPIPYQYKIENQAEFEKNQIVISSALDKVEPVVSDINEKSYRLEKNQQQIILPNMPEPVAISTPETKEKKSILPSFKKPVIPKPDPHAPYQSMIELRDDTLALIADWQLVVEWQSEGVEYFDDFSRDAYDDYLSTHRVMFRKDVEPILMRVYSQGLRIILTKEKEMAKEIASSQLKEAFQTRMDFPQPPR